MWAVRGLSDVDGLPMGCPRAVHGLPMDCPRTVRGLPIDRPLTARGYTSDRMPIHIHKKSNVKSIVATFGRIGRERTMCFEVVVHGLAGCWWYTELLQLGAHKIRHLPTPSMALLAEQKQNYKCYPCHPTIDV